MGQLMERDLSGGGGGSELPTYHEIRNAKLGFLKVSIFQL
jgi:hypothetical protein